MTLYAARDGVEETSHPWSLYMSLFHVVEASANITAEVDDLYNRRQWRPAGCRQHAVLLSERIVPEGMGRHKPVYNIV